MNNDADQGMGKVPELTFLFWVLKVVATTLGETGGDAVSMSMDLGYLIATAIFAVFLLSAVAAQITAEQFNPYLYWTTIIATTTVGTTLADFADRSLGIGYPGGASLLFLLLIASLAVWYRTLGTVSVASVSSPKAEAFYWTTIMFSQTLGTALGDWTADTAGLGYVGGALVVRRFARAGGCRLLLDPHLAYSPVLGGFRPHPSAWSRRRRPSRQADRCRWHGVEPILCVRRTAAVHARVHIPVSAEGRHQEPLIPLASDLACGAAVACRTWDMNLSVLLHAPNSGLRHA